jgi:hypothetical protein
MSTLSMKKWLVTAMIAIAVALALAVALVTSNNLSVDAAVLAVFFPDNVHFP